MEPTPTEDPRLGKPSASAYAIVENCPGQTAMVKDLPEDFGMNPDLLEWLARGTRIHKALELRNTSGLQDETEIEDYTLSLRYEAMMFEEWKITHNLSPEQIKGPFQEERLWLNHPVTQEPIMSGQLDIYWLAPPYALALDRKTGYNPRLPAAVQSGQLRVQAVLLWKEHDVSNIRIGHVKQKFKSTPSDYADYTATDLQFCEQSIMFHLWMASQEDAPRRPGSHCNWCKAKGICPEAGAYAMLPSATAGAAIDGLKGKALAEAIDRLVARMTPADLKKLWSKHIIIEKILEAATKGLKALDNDTLSELGLTRGKPRTTRTVTNPKAVAQYLSDYGLSEEAIWKCFKFTFGPAIEALRAEKQFTKDHAAVWLPEQIAAHIEEKDSDSPIEYK